MEHIYNKIVILKINKNTTQTEHTALQPAALSDRLPFPEVCPGLAERRLHSFDSSKLSRALSMVFLL